MLKCFFKDIPTYIWLWLPDVDWVQLSGPFGTFFRMMKWFWKTSQLKPMLWVVFGLAVSGSAYKEKNKCGKSVGNHCGTVVLFKKLKYIEIQMHCYTANSETTNFLRGNDIVIYCKSSSFDSIDVEALPPQSAAWWVPTNELCISWVSNVNVKDVYGWSRNRTVLAFGCKFRETKKCHTINFM